MSSSSRNEQETLLAQIADEFTDRCQQGERPSIQEYEQLYPTLAPLLRPLLSPIVALHSVSTPPPSASAPSPSQVPTPVIASPVYPCPTVDHVPNAPPPGSPEATPQSMQTTDQPNPWLQDLFPGAETSTADVPLVPGYDIVGELGRGGMGVVYKARQHGVDRLVALKMIRSGAQADTSELQRFQDEARAVGQLQHANIVQIFEVGVYNGLPYFSLELVEGGSLDKFLKGEPKEPRAAARQVQVLAEAMQVAHDRGLVHRDLKPANVLVTMDGALKITDFGLVKRLDEESARTQTGAIVGTPSYMAPEQALGQSKEIGPSADVYALGAILYECLSGRPPFKGANVLDTIQQVRHSEPVSPRALQPSVPKDLETICLKCLQKDPRKRYRDAKSLAEDLRRYLNLEPILARPIGRMERVAKWCRRNPISTALIATVIVATSLLGIIKTIDNARLSRVTQQKRQTTAKLKSEQGAKEKAQQEASEKTRKAQAALEKQEEADYWNYLKLAQLKAQRGDDQAVSVNLNKCSPRLRHWEWHYLNRFCGKDTPRWEKPASRFPWSFSADGKVLVQLDKPPRDRKSIISVFNTSSGAKLASWEVNGTVNGIRISQDNKTILVQTPPEVSLRELGCTTRFATMSAPVLDSVVRFPSLFVLPSDRSKGWLNNRSQRNWRTSNPTSTGWLNIW